MYSCNCFIWLTNSAWRSASIPVSWLAIWEINSIALFLSSCDFAAIDSMATIEACLSSSTFARAASIFWEIRLERSSMALRLVVTISWSSLTSLLWSSLRSATRDWFLDCFPRSASPLACRSSTSVSALLNLWLIRFPWFQDLRWALIELVVFRYRLRLPHSPLFAWIA